VLELEDLTRSFGATAALRGLSLQVREGTICGFVGPNGAGRTTTMRIVLGVLEPRGPTGGRS
jgi:ABC-2 type transport system ATP-binding protein